MLSVVDTVYMDSHFSYIADTNDNAYGEQTSYNLAQNPSTAQAARRTADSYGYYAIYTNVCYRQAPDGYTAYVPPCKTCSAAPTQNARTAIVCADSTAPSYSPSNAPSDASPSSTPTAAPTPSQIKATFEISLEGTTSSSFDEGSQTGFKAVVSQHSQLP